MRLLLAYHATGQASLCQVICINIGGWHTCVVTDTAHTYSCDCRGLVDYAAPLCYLFADQASCAVMFCSMYARYWCRLHAIDDTAGKHATLVSLCVFFVHLLEVMLHAQLRSLHVCHTHEQSIAVCICMCQ